VKRNKSCISFVIDVKRGEINNKNKFQNKWDKDEGSITSGGESRHREHHLKGRREIFPFSLLSKGEI
jgi:hypothetical protein